MDSNNMVKRTHPLVPIAAGSVLVMSLIGIGVFTGLIPNAMSSRADQPVAATASTAAPAPLVASGVVTAQPVQPAPVRRETVHPAPRPVSATPPPPVVAVAQCIACGRVESIQTVEEPGKATGVGAVAGGVGGAVLGNQVGHGNGRTAMTIIGAAGGALAGNVVEKHIHKQVSYRVNVRMDDGSIRTFTDTSAGAHAVGERVRIDNGALVPAG